MTRKLIVDLPAVLLVMLFTYAALSKLLQYSMFQHQLGQSPFVADYASTVVWLVPLSELLIAALLIVPQTRLTGLYLSYAMMLSFTIYIYAMLHYSPFIPCACGGVLSQMNWNQHLIFNIIFTLISLTGIFLIPVKK
ncbi:MauE/DoxX family redox-associated membrane protein [Chitinophaga rhizophila]|uniref:Methylamine utilisation protein MauE domain-containing protein n=1 Tax=Chitinophaga rhizophila TaxID=2866212 RepID=A0ABS7G7U6_9BACT|nr:MauE/DoxX family redox-associated membrane protein [Chitinophaga rhizophila]MBW8683737.1 hypothetical protein [Chitinophaga rhizophila]